jgi:hypothetical protein
VSDSSQLEASICAQCYATVWRGPSSHLERYLIVSSPTHSRSSSHGSNGFRGSGSHPTRFALPAPPGLFVRPKPSTSNIPALWSRCAPISVGDLHGSFGEIVAKVFGLAVPNISGSPQLPTSHSNDPSPANSVALVSPPNYKGDSAKIVFSTGPNATLVLGTTVSPPYPYQVEHRLRVHLPAHEQCKHPHYSS